MPRPLVLLAVAATLFGTTGTARALGAEHAPALGVGSARLIIGGALLAGWMLATRAPRAGLGARRVLVTGILIAAYQLAFFAALDRAGVAVGTIVTIGSGPLFAGLLGRAFGEPRPDRRWVAATLLAVAGGAQIVGPSGGAPPLGVALALLSGLGYAGYAVTSKSMLSRGARPEAVAGASFGTAALLLVPVLLASSPGWLAAPGGVATALYLGAIPTALAYVLFFRGLEHTGTATATTIVLLEPVVAAALGVAVLDEQPALLTVAGCALVLAALLVVATRPASEAESEALTLRTGRRGSAASAPRRPAGRPPRCRGRAALASHRRRAASRSPSADRSRR